MSRDCTRQAVHQPVMVEAVMELLGVARGGCFVDGTLGAGGHAAAILEGAPESRVLGIDRDPEILRAAGDRLAPYGERAVVLRGNYRFLPEILAGMGVQEVDGILLDLGVSSLQLDLAERGFSYTTPGAPLDMRMDPGQSLTAAGLLNRLNERELARILRDYGEERWASRIAKFAVKARDRDALTTVGDLVQVIQDAIPAGARRSGGNPARRTFQALRIAVNDELGALEDALAKMPALLAEGGRLVIISFHSLEDRMVKQRFRELAAGGGFLLLTRRARFPGDGEVEANPRARSARLRAISRIAPVLSQPGGE